MLVKYTKLKKFIELSQDIENLWANYKGSNRKLDVKYNELDNLIETLHESKEELEEIESYINSKYDNYFEKLLFARYYAKIDIEKFKAILEYVEEHGTKHAKFQAYAGLMFLKNSKV